MVFLNVSSAFSARAFSGTYSGGWDCFTRSRSSAHSTQLRMSLACTMPSTVSRPSRQTGKREWPLSLIFACTASRESSTSSHTTSVRGVISSFTRRSPRSKTPSIMSRSASSNMPCSMPWSIMTLISSSETGWGRAPEAPKRRSRPVEEALRMKTRGRSTAARNRMAPATARAMRSGLISAICLGTSSPSTIEKKVITRTTTATAIAWAYGASQGARAIAPASCSAIVVPPNAPMRMPMSVIPACTVERKRGGRSVRCRAVRARSSPSSASCWNRVRREETSAVSDIDRKPFSSTSRKMKMISRMIADMSRLLYPSRP